MWPYKRTLISDQTRNTVAMKSLLLKPRHDERTTTPAITRLQANSPKSCTDCDSYLKPKRSRHACRVSGLSEVLLKDLCHAGDLLDQVFPGKATLLDVANLPDRLLYGGCTRLLMLPVRSKRRRAHSHRGAARGGCCVWTRRRTLRGSCMHASPRWSRAARSHGFALCA